MTDELGRRLADYVRKDIYEADLGHMQTDIKEIKDGQKWMTRLLITQLLVLVVALLVFAATRTPIG